MKHAISVEDVATMRYPVRLRQAISLFLVKTPHRNFSHAHMSALPGDATSLATECSALRSLDSTHLASAPVAPSCLFNKYDSDVGGQKPVKLYACHNK